jgi:hypothetical protein
MAYITTTYRSVLRSLMGPQGPRVFKPVKLRRDHLVRPIPRRRHLGVSSPAMASGSRNYLPPWLLTIIMIIVMGFIIRYAIQPHGVDIKLKIYGGEFGKTYLGCINCETTDVDSVFNKDGPYGDPESPGSILNKGGRYGRPISAVSACDPQAPSPPFVVDDKGHYYGTLTTDPYDKGAFKASFIRQWLVSGVCGFDVTVPSVPGVPE